jgi:superfamily II helicase
MIEKERNLSQVAHIVLTKYEDRRYKKCKCCVCNTVSKCTPSNDFYSIEEYGEFLVCEKCFYKYLDHKLKIASMELRGL